MAEQERMVEAVLFATSEPITLRELAARMPHGCDPAEAMVYLRKRYEGRGVQVARVGDGYAMRTAADLGFLMQQETVEIRKLSRAAIETLAIIAYHQPVTRAEIEEMVSALSDPAAAEQIKKVAGEADNTAANVKKITGLEVARTLGEIASSSEGLGKTLAELSDEAASADGDLDGMIGTLAKGVPAVQELASTAASSFLALGPLGLAITGLTTALSFLSAKRQQAAKEHAEAEKQAAQEIRAAAQVAGRAIEEQQAQIRAARAQTLSDGQREISQQIELLRLAGRLEEARTATRRNQINQGSGSAAEKTQQLAALEREAIQSAAKRQADIDAKQADAAQQRLEQANAESRAIQAKINQLTSIAALEQEQLEALDLRIGLKRQEAELELENISNGDVGDLSGAAEVNERIAELQELIAGLDSVLSQNTNRNDRGQAETIAQVAELEERATAAKQALEDARKAAADLAAQQAVRQDIRTEDTSRQLGEVDQSEQRRLDQIEEENSRRLRREREDRAAQLQQNAPTAATEPAPTTPPADLPSPALQNVTGRLNELAQDAAGRNGAPEIIAALESVADRLDDGLQPGELPGISSKLNAVVEHFGTTLQSYRGEIRQLGATVERLASQQETANKF